MMEPVSDDELNAYVDNALGLDDRRRVDAILAEDAAARERVAVYRAQRAALAAHLDRSVGLPAPRTARLTGDFLSAQLLRAGARDPASRWFGRVAAVLVLLVVGWHAHALAARAGPLFDWLMVPRFVEEAADAHATLQAMRAWYPLLPPERAREAAEAMGWPGFTAGQVEIDRIDVFQLIGVALVPWDGGSALELVYVDAADNTVTLFVAAEAGEGTGEIDAVALEMGNFVFWQSGGFDYVVGSSLPSDILGRFARSIVFRLAVPDMDDQTV